MSASQRRLRGGIVCSLVTPFRRDEAPDLNALGDLIEFQIRCGVHGLFLLGTAGEGVLLGESERKVVAEMAVERVGGRVPLAIHCGAPDTKTAASLAAHAVAAGADAVAVVSPYYFQYGTKALRGHFERVAEAAAPAALYLYDNPERVSYSLDFGLVHDLCRDVDNVVGVKDTGDSIARVTRYATYTDPSVEVYTGNNLIVVPALVMGALGSVSALASAVPELFVDIYRRFTEGRLDEARSLQLQAARLQACLDGLPYVGGIKFLLESRGLAAGSMRAPLPSADEAGDEIRRRVDRVAGAAEWLRPVEMELPTARRS
jgi:4-hydroxy-tetrahydrodipicolinate synthase